MCEQPSPCLAFADLALANPRTTEQLCRRFEVKNLVVSTFENMLLHIFAICTFNIIEQTIFDVGVSLTPPSFCSFPIFQEPIYFSGSTFSVRRKICCTFFHLRQPATLEVVQSRVQLVETVVNVK